MTIGKQASQTVTMKDVATIAGVSYQTVSRVLNNSPRLLDSTRQRVLDAISQTGYRPNEAARSLVTSRTHTIGVVASESAQYGPSTSMTAIEHAAREAGYRLSIANIPADGGTAAGATIGYLLDQRVEALVVIAPQHGVIEALATLSIAVPVVTLESSGQLTRNSLAVDQLGGARLATRHLIDLGHTAISHIAGPRHWTDADARARGFLLEMEAAGLTAPTPVVGDWSARSGYRAAATLLASVHPTAIFAGNDQMALGFMAACRERGIDVPDQMSVVGFDDIPESRYFAPPLTTVRQDFAEIGRRAVAVLVAELANEHHDTPELLRPELVRRSSTAPAR